jgi:hypothetical protein
LSDWAYFSVDTDRPIKPSGRKDQPADWPPQAAAPFFLAGVWIVPFVLGSILSLTMIVGGWRMRQLKSYCLAIAATVLALFPCSLGWLIGLPMGIWALMMLNDQKVRQAFEY